MAGKFNDYVDSGRVIRYADMTVHADWYHDGWEGDEDLWRLDFHGTAEGDDNCYQAQLFALVKGHDDDDDGWDEPGIARRSVRKEEDSLEYTAFRLFLERDNRACEPAGWRLHPDPIRAGLFPEDRIDYACASWPISSERALKLLSLPKGEAAGAMSKECEIVSALSCDWSVCDVPPPTGGRPGSRFYSEYRLPRTQESLERAWKSHEEAVNRLSLHNVMQEGG